MCLRREQGLGSSIYCSVSKLLPMTSCGVQRPLTSGILPLYEQVLAIALVQELAVVALSNQKLGVDPGKSMTASKPVGRPATLSALELPITKKLFMLCNETNKLLRFCSEREDGLAEKIPTSC